MVNITASTRVTYPQGATSGLSTVLLAKSYSSDPSKLIIVTEETPFHPIDHTWPDQPADRGTLTVDGTKLAVSDVVTGAIQSGSKELILDKDIPVKKGTDGWHFVVAHIIDVEGATPPESLVGRTASLEVDPSHRRLLSAAHSACHIAALALNKCTAHLWRKEALKDSLGHPNLDQLAMQVSKITTSESLDHYRFGKSVRKQGLDSPVLLEQIGSVEECMNRQLEDWLRTESPIWIETPHLGLDARRMWHCDLPDGAAYIPCGGTHLKNLKEFSSIRVNFETLPGVPEVILHTVPQLGADTPPSA
jgi:alanyl-tRNA synthetase